MKKFADSCPMIRTRQGLSILIYLLKYNNAREGNKKSIQVVKEKLKSSLRAENGDQEISACLACTRA